jgi:hypothetical protein
MYAVRLPPRYVSVVRLCLDVCPAYPSNYLLPHSSPPDRSLDRVTDLSTGRPISPSCPLAYSLARSPLALTAACFSRIFFTAVTATALLSYVLLLLPPYVSNIVRSSILIYSPFSAGAFCFAVPSTSLPIPLTRVLLRYPTQTLCFVVLSTYCFPCANACPLPSPLLPFDFSTSAIPRCRFSLHLLR